MSFRFRSGLIALCLALGLLPWRTEIVRAQVPAKDTVRVDTSAGYARLLFTFTSPAPVSASVADGILSVRLTRTLDVTPESLAQKLKTYVTSARRDADGLTYRFALAQPVGLHNSTVANRTAIDLVPDSFKGVPPDLPPLPQVVKTAPDLAKLPVIKVRVGEYANYTRLIFDWPKKVTYSPYPGQGRVILKFDTLARPDFSMIESRSPAWVKNAAWHIEGKSLVVDFATDAESKFHSFADGTKVAVDVLAPKTDAAAYKPAQTLNAAQNEDAMAEAQAQDMTAQAVDHAITDAAASEVPGPRAVLTRDGAILHFPEARGQPVAVFTRGRTNWIVLSNHPALDPATLLAAMAPSIESADTVQSGSAAILRIVFKTPLLASVSQSEASLDITLAASGSTPPEPIQLTRQGANGLATLGTLLPGAVHALALADSDAGDMLLVVPGFPGRGVLTPKRFVELEAIPSAAGLVVRPLSDDLAARVRDSMVEFGRPHGLALSNASGLSDSPIVQVSKSSEGATFIDFAAWKSGEGTDIEATERKLRAAAAKLPESDANKARMRLARYLLANQLAPEALGQIGVMISTDRKLETDPAILIMTGAAQMMMGRASDARTTLSAPSLSADPHAAFWRGLAQAELALWADARRDLTAATKVVAKYPGEWQAKLRFARASTGLAMGDVTGANDALDRLPGNLSHRDSLQAKLLKARLLAAQSHVNEAVSQLRALENADYVPVAVQATYARVEVQLGAKKIAPKDAIEALETLRFRWRGDMLELNTLRKLGSLYFQHQRWREGFDTLKVASLYFPSTDIARVSQDDMRSAYVDLFLNGKADAMKPVEALSLFYDFIELTPIGREGDEMIRRLSERLVTVDLLGPATELLEHQVNKRLEGVARAVVATKLASIYLLDHRPKDALRIINETRQTRLPDDVNAQRRLLEARALAGLKQYTEAVDLIADDDTLDARRARADIYWDSANWKVAGAKAEEILSARANPSATLSDDERMLVMRAAVAYTLADDDASRLALITKYSDAMRASPDGKAFETMTEKAEISGASFRELARKIASIDTLQAFMTDYRARTKMESKVASN
jgi:hypothetical protein